MSYSATYLARAEPYWEKLHPTELRRTLLNYAAPYLVTLHSTELLCTLLS